MGTPEIGRADWSRRIRTGLPRPRHPARSRRRAQALACRLDRPQTRASSIIEEGRLLAQVRHPNVVTIHGAERIGDQVGLWMELVEGRTLEQILEQGRRFTVTEVVEIGIQLCGAIAAVHDAGLLHRDIKSQNVMLADDGRLVLMDFGTGRELGDNSAAGLAGTPLYLAPELLSGKEPTVRSDIYASACFSFTCSRVCTRSPQKASRSFEVNTSGMTDSTSGACARSCRGNSSALSSGRSIRGPSDAMTVDSRWRPNCRRRRTHECPGHGGLRCLHSCSWWQFSSQYRHPDAPIGRRHQLQHFVRRRPWLSLP